MIKNEEYQKEQNQLLQTILNYRFFNPWKNLTSDSDTNRSLRLDSDLELYITSTCNQKCSYCYLQKYPELYPAEFNKPEIILHNLDILLKYFLTNDYNIPKVSLFSGDIWHTEFGWNVLELLYTYVSKGLKIEWIMIPTNCSFVMDKIAVQKIQQFIDKFNQINCPLVMSISIDGKIIDNASRPRNDKLDAYTEEFYELVGAFAARNKFLFHPMISSQNVKYWKENYEWWEEYLDFYGYNISAIMMLEVRNGDWTDENIKEYGDFINFVLDKFIKDLCNNDPKDFIKYLSTKADNTKIQFAYSPWLICKNRTYKGCTISQDLTIRLGDLAICPCHRTAYQKYLYGHFIVENDTIIGIEANNPVLATHILMANSKAATPLCDTCFNRDFCLQGCLGSQLEYGKDLIFPLENICKFLKAKTVAVIKYYREHGIIDALKEVGPNEYYSEQIAIILKLNDRLGDNLDGLGKI